MVDKMIYNNPPPTENYKSWIQIERGQWDLQWQVAEVVIDKALTLREKFELLSLPWEDPQRIFC